MVSFNFDDGYKNVYDNALPIFKKYGVVGCIFPVVEYLVFSAPWAVTWPQLLEFQQAGWEIGSHTMTHPHLTTLTDAQLDYELGESQRILADHGFNAKTLVFPYNEFDARVLDYTTRYYENSRGGLGINGFACDRYGIVCREVSATTTPDEAIAWINAAISNRMWLVLMMHEVVTGPPAEYQYNAADLEKIVAYVATNHIPAQTMQQALARRQASLGPNLIKNPNLKNLDPSGWARDWSRNHAAQVSVEPATVPRVFSSHNRLKIAGSSQQNVASTNVMKLPAKKRRYYCSFFIEVANTGPIGGTEIYLDEFDKDGIWLGGQWLGGFYANTFGMPGYLYQPTSQEVDQVMIDIYSAPGANITFYGDNFYFGVIKNGKSLAPIVNLLLGG
ncbi:MAG: polysaccharide deacetylase family protein [Thermodesulfobacteriota bacterium]